MEHILQKLHNAPQSEYLNLIASTALDPKYTDEIFAKFSNIFADTCARWISSESSDTTIISALGRIVPLAPYLAEYAERYLQRTSSNSLLCILDFAASSNSSNPPEDLLTEHLLGVFRLLVFDNACFARFLQPAALQLLLSHPALVVRYLAIRILCLYLHAADAAYEEMVKKYVGDQPILGYWEGKQIDYRFLSLWEEKRYSQLHKKLATMERASNGSQGIPPDLVSEAACKIGQVFLPRLAGPSSGDQTMIVPTETTLRNLNSIAQALLSPKAIMVTGLAGSGKTMLIRHLAHKLNKADSLITLHLNEQSDVKMLIGMYTTGNTPGSFCWQPGVLTTAVKEGRWILIEDFDRTPNEIVSALLPLIERGELLVPSRGEVVKAARGFKIIATMRTTKSLKGDEIVPKQHMLGSRLWQFVGVSALEPGSEEFAAVINGRYPSLYRHIPRLLKAFSSINDRKIPLISKTDLIASARSLTSRDFMKWCDRISAVLTDPAQVTQEQLDNVLLEAFDCFAGSFQSQDSRLAIMSCIAQELHIDPQRRDHVLMQREIRLEASEKQNTLWIGRTFLQRNPLSRPQKRGRPFSVNPYTLRLLEKLAVAVSRKEPLLLVGETGTGKTTSIQHLASQLGRKMVAFNLSQQSESGDLLGGFKPQNTRSLIVPMKDEFDELFNATFSAKKNQKFIEVLGKRVAKGEWKRVCALWREALKMVEAQKKANASQDFDEHPAKKRKTESKSKVFPVARWQKFASDLDVLESQVANSSTSFAFAFQEGNIVKAMRNGDWVLLDEINLASSDTLEALGGLFESGEGSASILLSETGRTDRIRAHPEFRIFAAMNPATDVGKKDLPPGIRSRFTELWVESPDTDVKSLCSIVESYLGSTAPDAKHIAADVTALYLEIQKLSNENVLVDGAEQKPHFSLRTLTRTLTYAQDMASCCSLRRGLFEGFHMSFCTFLNKASEQILAPIIATHLFGKHRNTSAELRKPLAALNDGRTYIREGHHWLRQGSFPPEAQAHYIITPFVQRNLTNLIRATSTRRYPVLIQGPTSSGKTSMIEYLAKRSGNKFVRINNHEHTDLQEYLGTYVSDSSGQLRFQEGILVQALRQGHWIVLDELNLAPTDVLEALNRLLDDNRELLIPETQEVVRPHENFMLFATQNPAGLYGGRKVLSRAFRNRFLELHFDDIPVDELTEILHRRTMIPESWCKRIVNVYNELSILRQEDRIFEQKSFATLRDLFRWALRKADTVQDLAVNGYMLLAERVRKTDERKAIKDIIDRVMSKNGPRVKVDEKLLYDSHASPDLQNLTQHQNKSQVVWTGAMRRLCVLVAAALRNNEPVLLVGETGCGKTTVCQLLADAIGKELFIVNAHQNTETGDLIGSQRPVRNRAVVEELLRQEIIEVLQPRNEDIVHQDLSALLSAFDSMDRSTCEIDPATTDRITTLRTRAAALFEWSDGSLVQAMKTGQYFLLDEISLADDSVLERLNSVLESHRTLFLAEKGTEHSTIVAQDGFQFMATMNPGGDYGKKELSPALRNRFTEIWVPALSDLEDISDIVQSKLVSHATPYAATLVSFAQWFNDAYNTSAASAISIRDMLSWITFINKTAGQSEQDIVAAVVHGAAMVYIDTLGANPAALLAISPDSIPEERQKCLDRLCDLLQYDVRKIYFRNVDIQSSNEQFTIGSFSVPRVGQSNMETSFSLAAPTTRSNAMRILRALQLVKPILLEGNPGVGKTTIVTALAQGVGESLTRINLSEQTDLIDLFGSDVPVEGEQAGTFAWRDAPFLRAMKNGHWVLLDEMNLASQSVLEGLNACLDHRGEVYVSELDQTFRRHPNFRVFAAQNPHHQGGGRKGLPASFVNRFTVVYADVFTPQDLSIICSQVFPHFDSTEAQKLIQFVVELEADIGSQRFGSQGSPWEFNLRDTFRWMQLLTSKDALLPQGTPLDFLNTVFTHRFRTETDRRYVEGLFDCIFDLAKHESVYHNLSKDTLQVGLGLLPRNRLISPTDSKSASWTPQLSIIESFMICIQQRWPVILTGPSGSGKSLLINQAAAAAGAKVVTFSLSADIDAMDLVGGYEQIDPSRQVNKLLVRLADFAQAQIVRKLCHGQSQIPEMLDLLTLSPTSFDVTHIISFLEQYAERETTPEVEDLLNELKTVASESQAIEGARFQWVDGILVEALQQGYWLVLDNANLCSPSVLDRLNSLLEPNGHLSINEHPADDGTARVVRPHPSSRIFLTVDPKYGELSRAMRNRGVEIYISFQPDCGPEERNNLASFQFESSIYRFRHVGKELEVSQQSKSTDSLLVSFDHLAPVDFKFVESFQQQLNAGIANISPATDLLRENGHSQPETTGLEINHNLISDSTTSGFIDFLSVASGLDNDASPLGNYTKFISQLPEHWRRQLAQLYKNTLPKSLQNSDFQQAQSIHPMNNELLVRQNSALSCATWLASIYDLCQTIFLMEINLEHRKVGAGGVSGHKLLVRKIRSFLTHLKDTMARWVNDLLHDGSIEEDTALVLNDIRYIWSNLQHLLHQHVLDEATFTILLAILSDLVTRLPQSNGLTASFQLKILKGIGEFKHDTALSTGHSMEQIWKAARPITARSQKALDAVLALEKVAADFDCFIWQINQDPSKLCQIRAMLAQGVRLILQEDFDATELITELSTSVEQMRPQETSTQGVLAPYFREIFATLVQLSEIHEPSSSEHKISMDMVWFYSQRPIAAHSIQERSKAFFSFKALQALNNSEYATKSLLANTMHLDLLKKLSGVRTVHLAQFDQLRSELGLLGHHIARETQMMKADIIEQLDLSLASIYRDLLKIHTALLQDNGGFPDVSSHVPADSYFRVIMTRFLHPVQSYLHHPPTNKTERRVASSVAWMRLGIAGLLLYVPDRVFDPALRPKIERELFWSKKSSLQATLDALVAHQKQFGNPGSTLRIQNMKERISSMGEEPSVPEIIRPANSEVGRLQGEFNNLLHTVRPIIQVLERENHPRQPMDESIEANLAVVSRRLTDIYPHYADITALAVGFINVLQTGISLARHEGTTERPSNEDRISFIANHTPFAGCKGEILPTYLNDLSTLDPSVKWDVLKSVEVQRNVLRVVPKPVYNDSTIISHIFDSFYAQWKDQLAIDQQKHAASSSIYTFKSKNPEEEDEEAENDLFPDFEGEGVNQHVTSDGTSAQKLAQRLANIHESIFVGSKPAVQTMEEQMNQAANAISHAWTDERNHMSTTPTDMLPLILMHLKAETQILQEGNVSAKTYNFYYDPNITEATKFKSHLSSIRTRFRSIQLIWPEHMTLADVINTVDEAYTFSFVDPIAKMITKAEKLHSIIYEWQRVASKEYSAAVVFDELTALIVSWRRLELSTWARLLDMEMNKSEDEAKEWFFVAYEAIVSATLSLTATDEADIFASSLLRVLEGYMTSTNLGQYISRLKLLQQMREHLKIFGIPIADVVVKALGNFIDYYSKFSSAVTESIKTLRKPIEKELVDVIRMASYKDTNIDALRQSAKRSHQKLTKYVRKFRDVLRRPVTSLLKNEMAASVHTTSLDITPRLVSIEEDLVSLKLCEQLIPDWASRPPRFQNLVATTSLMLSKVQRTKDAVDVSDYLESFRSNLELSVSQLRKATPSQLTEENTDTVKHLKTRKRKLFADVLKELRQMGFKSNIGTDVIAQQDSLASILAVIPSSESCLEFFEYGDTELYKILQLMPQIRDVSKEHSPDLTPAEVSRSSNFFESLLHHVLRQRQSLAKAAKSLSGLEILVQQIIDLWAPSKYGIETERKTHDSKTSAAWLSAILNVASNIIKAQASLGSLDLSNLIEALQSRARQFEDLVKESFHLPQLPSGVTSERHSDLELRMEDARASLESAVSVWSQEYPVAEIVLDHIKPWANRKAVASDVASHDLNERHEGALKNISSDIFRAADALLAAMQQVEKSLETSLTSTEEPSWLVRQEKCLATALNALRIPEVSSNIQSVLDITIKTHNNENLRAVSALLTTVLPLFQQHLSISQYAVSQYSRMHASSLKTLFSLSKIFVALGTQGFCTPAEKSNEKGDGDEKLEGGTGLGEGEGAEDISKDIKDDEDLTELAQEPDENDKNQDIEDEKDAVDMADEDMEGKMGDATEEKEDEGNEEEEEEDGDMDEQTGDVSDLGDDAVDEKMWDEGGADNDKDKEGDQKKGQKNEDEQVAAQENATEEQKEQQDAEAASEDAEEEAAAEETEAVSKDEMEKTDPHLQESEKLDLPEDIGMDDASDDGSDGLGDMDEADDLPEEKDQEEPDNGKSEEVEQEGEQESGEEMPENNLEDEVTNEGELEEEEGEVDGEDQTEEDAVDEDMENTDDVQPIGDESNEAEAQDPATETGAGVDANDNPDENQGKSQNAAQREKGDEGQAAENEQQQAPGDGEQQARLPESGDRGEQAEEQTPESQAFKKMGDALERWYKQHQQIQTSTEKQDPEQKIEKDVDMADADFEHLPDENAEADAQAIGTATEEEAKAIDESMALPSNERQEKEDPDQHAMDIDKEEPDHSKEIPTQENQQPRSKEPAESDGRPNAFVGETRSQDNLEDEMDLGEHDVEDNESDVDVVETQLSGTHLEDSSARTDADSRALWAHHESSTRTLAQGLTEQLRLILEPTSATKLRGDFRTGKRLNLKRIIPYIASGYKRDKIWLRRSLPSKRAYQIMIAVDDSQSMAESGSADLAFETVALVARSLTMLEAGELCVVGFGNDVRVTHPFEKPFTSDAGAEVFSKFGFKQDRTDVRKLVDVSTNIFQSARLRATGAGADLWQLQIIISDGVCDNHAEIQRLVRKAQEQRIMVLFVIVDAGKNGDGGSSDAAGQQNREKKQSILDLQSVDITEDGKVVRWRYMDRFPFKWYLVVRDVRDLPSVLATALRQWFAEVVESG